MGGVAHTLGGTVDHVHMVVAIPPAIAVAIFVGQVKGVASARLNKPGISAVRFEWQAEYGAFSFDAKRLPNFTGYVERQKEHHDDGTIIPILERMRPDNQGPLMMREAATPYTRHQDRWRDELLQLDASSHALE